MTIFNERKRRILEKLLSDEPDLSPKGTPDDDILELLELINASEGYVSTSSCSGRVVVFLDADKDGQGDNAKGRWLMNRHSPFHEQLENASIQELYALLFGTSKIGRAWVSTERLSRVITLKFEPLVLSMAMNLLTMYRLHIYCAAICLRRHHCSMLPQHLAFVNQAFQYQHPEHHKKRSSLP
jgi:tRNA wybutosine-synthesizing protein 3